jgi:hypothetical protein
MITHTEEYKTKIVGVSFENEDGTSRQEVIELCSEGDALSLEHYYYKDEDAFKVTNLYGEALGNLKKELTEKLVEKYDIATIEAADVEILNITGEDKGTLGVNIQITITDSVTNFSTATPTPTISKVSTGTQPVTKPQASNTIEMLHNKYGTQKLKSYSVILKILFIISLVFALFTLIFSIPFAVIFGIISFICFKYSKLYKKAANYSK